MSKRARSKKPNPDDMIFMLVEGVLDDFFGDPKEQANYKKLARGGRNARETVSIGEYEFSDDGEVALSVRVGSPEILVSITHHSFKAEIVAHYEIGTATMTEARIAGIEGDREQAGECAGMWFDELVDDFDDEIEDLQGALAALLSDSSVDEDDDDDDPGEPPPPTDADKIKVGALAKALAREMKRKKPDMMAHQDGMLELEHSPQMLWPILEGTVAASAAHPRDDALVEAWRLLLEGQLTVIRYRIDRGWDWAVRMIEEYQRKLIEIGQAKLVSPEDFAAIAGALGEAGIEVKPETREALANAGLTLPEPEQREDLSELMGPLMDEMASSVSSPFEVAESLGQATQVMPSEIRVFMAHEFARSSHALLRESVPLMLLSDDNDVRRAAAEALKQTATPDTMSPTVLRRMIAVRNWVPQADRAFIDQAIREARTKGVDCAQWPPARDLMITASFIDGSGAQNVILTDRGKRKGVLAGVLLKSATGVADSWCDIEVTRREINETLVSLRDTGATYEVGRAYLDDAVQHAIAVGIAAGKAPDSSLLQIAELVGGVDWRDHRLDVAAEAKRLFDALPAELRSPVAIEGSLARSGQWIDEDFAESWFIDDPEARAITKRGARRDAATVIDQLIAEVMPKRNNEWAERFLLLALRAKAAVDRAHRAYADDFVILVHSLCENRDLTTIPLMVAIARHTIGVSRMARW